MAQFRLVPTPPFGTCLTCGTSADAVGFVDLVATTKVVRDSYEITGDVDVVLCSACVEQASNMVGAISISESEKLYEDLTNTRVQYAKAADEAASWQQRYENLVEIMSMLELTHANPDSSDSDTVGGSTDGPEPDLRVQEGRDLPSKNNRKAKSTIKS